MRYAVQLYFDAELEAALLAVRAALTKAGVTPTLERLRDRPHVSLAVLDDADVPSCVSVLERIALRQAWFSAGFAAFGTFAKAQGIVYLSPAPSERLLTMHRRMCRELRDTGARIHEHCVPGNWLPHAKVGFELPRKEVSVALSWLQANFKPVSGRFSSLGLVEFPPVKEMATFDLSGGVEAVLASLGILPQSIAARCLARHPEADDLVVATTADDGREHLLTPAAAAAWRNMFAAARSEGVALRLFSAFRGVEVQTAIIRAKLVGGLPLDEILCVNAPPGYSEHHTGRAVDVTTVGVLPLQVEFETTEAFRWLSGNAGRFGFVLSYPRNNVYGFNYEPWHWCFKETETAEGRSSRKES
jgi:D-alanyl-D-alanine carboxypeptidase